MAKIARIWDGTQWVELASSLVNYPDQTGNSGKFLTTDGSSVSWEAISGGTPLNTPSTIVARDSDSSFDISSIDFDTTANSVSAIGRLTWDDGDGSLYLGLKGGNVDLPIGQESVVLSYNGTGSVINKGQVVYISGAQGQRPSVSLSSASAEMTSSKTLGVASEQIGIGEEGFVTTFGIIRGLNTELFTPGSALWLSTTAGGLTQTPPASPDHAVFVGYCVKSNQSSGEIFVSVQNGYEIEELHNVLIDTPLSGDVLQYNSTTGLWENNVIGATFDVLYQADQPSSPQVGDIWIESDVDVPEYDAIDLSSYATLSSPIFTGTPIAPTASSETNTTQIATTAFAQSLATNTLNLGLTALTNHESDTTNIHGIADTSLLATTSYVDTAESDAVTSANSYSDSLAVNYDPAGSAATAQSNAESYADSAVSTHSNVTSSVHGISDTSNLIYTDDSRLSDSRTPTSHALSHADGGSDEITISQSQVTDLTNDLSAKAPLDSPSLTGTPTAPTASAGNNSTQVATTAYADTAAANAAAALVDSAPSTLDTLNELAAALGDDENFSTTITNSLATKAPIASPSFTGTASVETLSVDSTAYIDTVTTTVSSTSNTVIDSFVQSSFSSCEYLIQIKQGSKITVLKALMTSVDLDIVQYGIVESGGSIPYTITTDSFIPNGGSITNILFINITDADTTTATVKVVRTSVI